MSATASIRGTLIGDDGTAIGSAFVTAINVASPSNAGKSSLTTASGAYSIDGLSPGTYKLCVQVPNSVYLDPCHWTDVPAPVAVTTGQFVTSRQVVAKKASQLQIRISDPDHHLAPRSAATEPPQVLLAVITPAGTTAAPILTAVDRTGRTYSIAVMRDVPLTLTVAGKKVFLVDDRGVKLPNTGTLLTFQHMTGAQTQKSFTFTAVGHLD